MSYFFDDLIPLTNQINDFLISLDKKQPIILFGGGFALNNCFAILCEYNASIVAICDNDVQKQGTYYNNIKIYSLEDAIALYPNALFVISSSRYFSEIMNQLKKNISDDRICKLDLQNWHYFKGTAYRDYMLTNADDFQEFYELLADDLSRDVLYKISKAHFTGKREDFAAALSTPNDWYLFDSLMCPSQTDTYVDCGAYDGDSILAFCKNGNNKYSRIYALEPDDSIYKCLQATIQNNSLANVEIIKKGAFSSNTTLTFINNGVYSQLLNSNNAFEKGISVTNIEVIKLDDLFPTEDISIIKMDIEGSEFEALKGAEALIKRCKPRLAICLYHNFEDFLRIPKLIRSFNPDYNIVIRQHEPFCTDTILYAY